ncbi:hypothetical protein ACWGNE_01810 [Streptomyces xiamenensis]|uniref:hypothetical protein n=1 Tax=Streptomyces sp. XC 2026 TaxID=2782004 RepID=UPI0019054B27|nr:hypothetical protein [Streptomyces sp. XC 2026]QQN78753.1 hypothetical protein IPZ77_15870 [Streptomyces sp. XC 2026]
MLMAGRGRGATTGGLLVVLAMVVGLLSFLGAGRAAADPDCDGYVNADGDFVYDCRETTPGENGSGGGSGGGGGGNTEPACALDWVKEHAPGADEWYCMGQNACWVNNPTAYYPTPDTWPEEPPSEGAVYVYRYCYAPDGSVASEGYTWYTGPEDEGPSIEELALQAFGALSTPDFSLAHSPPRNSIIYIDTWWWADGPSSGTISGSAALGVVAVGTPSHIEVDPGDGSGVMTCDFVTAESDACSYTYDRAGDYTSRGRLVYDVHFEQNGSPLDIAGLPDSLESGWQESAITVAESQAVVVP